MTLEQLEAEIKAIKKKCDDDIQKLRIEYLKGQVKYKAGDIVTDHNGSIIVESYKLSLNYMDVFYFGIELKKDGTPAKKQTGRWVYQQNILNHASK